MTIDNSVSAQEGYYYKRADILKILNQAKGMDGIRVHTTSKGQYIVGVVKDMDGYYNDYGLQEIVQGYPCPDFCPKKK